jgi:hypothetical protein
MRDNDLGDGLVSGAEMGLGKVKGQFFFELALWVVSLLDIEAAFC